jgi:hypothetical protein
MFNTETESRSSLRVECQSTVLCDLGARKIPARLLDLSWTGLRLESERPIPAGSLIQLQGATTVWCVCRWCTKTPDGNYWSGHELRDGALSPSQQWVSKILESNGLNTEHLRNRRRVRRYDTEIASLLQGQPGAKVVNLSLFGACIVHDTRVMEKELSIQLDLGHRQMLLQALCLQTRTLGPGEVAHHLCWEARPAQTRAVAFLLGSST